MILSICQDLSPQHISLISLFGVIFHQIPSDKQRKTSAVILALFKASHHQSLYKICCNRGCENLNSKLSDVI